MKYRSSIEVVAQIIAALMWGPKSAGQIADYAGLRNNKGTWTKHKATLRAEGLIYVSGWQLRGQPIYALQPTPFANEDAPKPAPKYKPKTTKYRESMSGYMEARGIA